MVAKSSGWNRAEMFTVLYVYGLSWSNGHTFIAMNQEEFVVFGYACQFLDLVSSKLR